MGRLRFGNHEAARYAGAVAIFGGVLALRFLLLGSLALPAAAGPALAQEPGGLRQLDGPQPAQSMPGPPASQTFEVVGRLVGEQGAGLADAEIVLLPREGEWASQRRLQLPRKEAPGVKTTTNEDGWFRLVAPGGLWRVAMSAPGHSEMEVLLEPLLRDAALGEIGLPVARSQRIEVTGVDGRALADALVLCRPTLPRRTRQGVAAYVRAAMSLVRTNGDGRATCTVPLTDQSGRGRLVVEVTRPGVAPLSASTSASTSTAYLGALQSLAFRELPAVWRVELEAGVGVRLRVEDSAGASAPGALVRGAGLQLPEAWADERGVAWVGVAAERSARQIEVLSATGGASLMLRDAARGRSDDAGTAVRAQLAAVLVSGEVRDAANRPVPAALVWSDGGASAVTGSDGSYRMLVPLGFDDGEVLVHADAGNHTMASERLLVAAAPIAARQPATRQFDLDLELGAARSVRVLVLQHGELPIKGAQVALSAGARRREVTSLSPHTDERGAAFLRDLRVGSSYTIQVRAPGYIRETLELPLPAPPEPAVGSLQEERSQVTEVVVRLSPIRTFFGWVEDEGGVPVSGAQVVALPLRGGRQRRGVPAEEIPVPTDTNGRFTLRPLAWGSYELLVVAPGFAPARIMAVEVVEDSPRELGTIVLSPGWPLVGRVVDTDGAPISDVTLQVAAEQRRNRPVHEIERKESRTHHEGTFRFDDLATGSHRLLVHRSGFQHTTVVAEIPSSEPLVVTLAPGVSFEAIVKDEAGDPIPSVTALIRPASGDRTIAGWSTSDDRGVLRFEDVRPDRYALQVMRAAGSGLLVPLLENFEVHAEEPILRQVELDREGRLEVVLRAGAELSGRVVDSDGAPAAGVRVSVRPQDTAAGRPTDADRATDAAGRYRLEGLPTGLATVRLESGKAPPLARDLEIHDGENIADFVLEPGFDVSGRVVDAAGRAVPAATVEVRSVGGRWPQNRAVSGADGAFSVGGLAAGSYSLLARSSGHAPAELARPLEVSADVFGVELVLGEGASIQGVIRGLVGDALLSVTLRAERLGASRVGGRAGAAVDFEGRFSFEGLLPGSWRVLASESEGHRVVERVVELGDGESVEIELEFEDGYRLTGEVLRGDRPVPSVEVVLETLDQARPRTVDTTDGNGRFRFEGLAAGRARISLFEGGFSRLERAIEIEGNREVSLQWPTATLRGRVVGDDGTPIEGATVELLPAAASSTNQPRSGRRSATASTMADGHWEMRELADDRFLVRASKAGFSEASLEVDVTSDAEVVAADLVLRRGSELALRLLGATAERWFHVLRTRGDGVATSHSGRVSAQGLVLLTGIPPGRHRLVMGSGFLTEVEVEVPPPDAEPIPVVLAPELPVRLRVLPLERTGQLAYLRLVAPQGAVYRDWTPPRIVDELVLHRGNRSLRLQPGRWTAQLRTNDGDWQAEYHFDVTTPEQMIVLGE